jgi:hypothetical protein
LRAALFVCAIFIIWFGSALSKESRPGKPEHKTEAPNANNQRRDDDFQQMRVPFTFWFNSQPLPPVINIYTNKHANDKSECAEPKNWKEWGSFAWCRSLEWIDPDRVIAIFTVVLGTVTFFLWLATRNLVRGAEKIGEAQVRAYVNIKSASIDFLSNDTLPRVMFIASNSGQSPARNFIWNVTLQYPGIPANRQSAPNENWLEQVGMDIPATSEAPPDRAFIPDMSVKQYIEEAAPGTTLAVIRTKVDFRFTDVFDRDWFGEAFFSGIMQKRSINDEDLKRGISQWTSQISAMARPRDWNDVRKANNTQGG